MRDDRPGLAFIGSPDGGLGHYVLHLWRYVVPWARPVFLTSTNRPPDELVAQHIPDARACLDYDDPSTIESVASLVSTMGIGAVNVQVATTARRHARYLAELLAGVRRRDVRVLLTLHDVLPYSTLAFDEANNSRLLAQADGFVVGNQAERSRLTTVLPGDARPVAIAPHGPYDLFANTGLTRREARRRLRLPSDAPVVLSFGAWRPDKGLDTLLDAHRHVVDTHPSAVLLMHAYYRYGVHPEFSSLSARASAQSGVRFTSDYLPWREVVARFVAADVVALPYEHVSQSGIFHLARALGKPVVVTPEFPDVERIEPWPGRLAASGSASSIAEALRSLLAVDPADAAARAREGWARAFPAHGWRENAGALREVVGRARFPTGSIPDRGCSGRAALG